MGRGKLPVWAYVPESLDQRILVGRFRGPVIKEQSRGCGDNEGAGCRPQIYGNHLGSGALPSIHRPGGTSREL